MLTNCIESFKKIRTDINRTRWLANTKYRDPDKSLLLPTIFDLISQGEIKNNLIELTLDFEEKQREKFKSWVESGKNCGIKELAEFAFGSKQDEVAITESRISKWSNR
jgi:transposase